MLANAIVVPAYIFLAPLFLFYFFEMLTIMGNIFLRAGMLAFSICM